MTVVEAARAEPDREKGDLHAEHQACRGIEERHSPYYAAAARARAHRQSIPAAAAPVGASRAGRGWGAESSGARRGSPWARSAKLGIRAGPTGKGVPRARGGPPSRAAPLCPLGGPKAPPLPPPAPWPCPCLR